MTVGLWDVYDEICILASRRDALHADHDSCRPLSPDYELVGLLGEFAFGRRLGLPVDVSVRPSGDGGIDFKLPCGQTVDVKTSRKLKKRQRIYGAFIFYLHF